MKRMAMLGALTGALVFGAAATSQAYIYPRPIARAAARAALPPYGPRVFVGPRAYMGPRAYVGPRVYGPRAFYGPRAYGPVYGYRGPAFGPGWGPGVGVGIGVY